MDRVIVKKDLFEDGIYKNSSNLTLAQLLSEESIHKVDLNKDNVIGDTVTSVISNQDSRGFYKIASGSYVIDNSGLNVGNASQNPIIPAGNNKPTPSSILLQAQKVLSFGTPSKIKI